MATAHAYQSLQSEVDRAVSDGTISSPITSREARDLPYLQVTIHRTTHRRGRILLTWVTQAVVYEGLRLNTPLTSLASKEVPPEGDTINGQFVPGGTRLGQSLYSIMRDKAVFGNDADLFRPERWLEISDLERLRWRQQVELAFGTGRWGCCGKSLAFLEMNKVYVEVRLFPLPLQDGWC